MKPSLFIVEDDRDSIELLREIFGEKEYILRCHTSPIDALARLTSEGLPDLVLLDLMMPQMDGITLLGHIRQLSASLPVIMMTAHGSIETAVEALKKGASDYITKPFSFEELRLAVRNALELTRLRRRIEVIDRNRRGRYSPGTLLGEHAEIAGLREVLVKVAAVSTTCVLLRGESGTGKNHAARIIHFNSPLAEGPFVELNCAAVPAGLLESELFGYRRGAFTGATSDKQGIIEQAAGGTLFLDEIAELPPELQSKLLSFLESKRLRRLGDVTEREVDTRLITATNRDLEKLMSDGLFRQDLFFRINVVNCYLPPLRRLGRDVLLIAQKFIAEFNQQFSKSITELGPEAENKLLAHDWPGNVRELRNVIERAMLFAAGPRLEAADLQIGFAGAGQPAPSGEFVIPPAGLDWEQHEKAVLAQALERCRGNQSKAARLLSMSRDTFVYRAAKFGLI
ncbi:MAG TPA: sigma-54 dependent transcriptional regulator [Candidatus Glassbacteria bacterium]|nr:sigma-54 dependent transcriptional regulator [Candidatus Glassbacteria bacterium]